MAVLKEKWAGTRERWWIGNSKLFQRNMSEPTHQNGPIVVGIINEFLIAKGEGFEKVLLGLVVQAKLFLCHSPLSVRNCQLWS
jgi:hypothetical protein